MATDGPSEWNRYLYEDCVDFTSALTNQQLPEETLHAYAQLKSFFHWFEKKVAIFGTLCDRFRDNLRILQKNFNLNHTQWSYRWSWLIIAITSTICFPTRPGDLHGFSKLNLFTIIYFWHAVFIWSWLALSKNPCQKWAATVILDDLVDESEIAKNQDLWILSEGPCKVFFRK